jgi:hypothetical protein
MADEIDIQRLRDAFERTGCRWILHSDDSDAMLRGVARDLGEFVDEYERRFQKREDPFALLDEDRAAATAFFQLYSGSRISKEMRVMVWRIARGAEILSLNAKYHFMKEFSLDIRLRSYDRTEAEDYRTGDPWDYRVLQFINMMTVENAPVLVGIFPE